MPYKLNLLQQGEIVIDFQPLTFCFPLLFLRNVHMHVGLTKTRLGPPCMQALVW